MVIKWNFGVIKVVIGDRVNQVEHIPTKFNILCTHMAARVISFIEKATVNQLKEKLDLLGHPTAGAKNVLKLRLGEAIKNISNLELEEIFPNNFVEGNMEDDANTGNGRRSNEESFVEDEDELLSRQVELLQEKLAKKQKIAELQRQISQLTVEEDTASARSTFNFHDAEDSLNKFSGEDNYS